METPAAGRASDTAPQQVLQRTPERILMVRLGAIGDCLRVLPVLAKLRAAFPEAEIGWAVGDLAAPLVEGHPALTRLHVVSRRAMKAGLASAWAELRRAGGEIAAARYDVAIDFHTRLKSGYLAMASRAPLRIGLDRRSGTEANFLFTNCHVRLSDVYENRVERFAHLLAPLGIDGDPATWPRGLWIEPAALARMTAAYEAAGRPAVAVFPGTSARRAADRWPVSRWCDAVGALGERGTSSMVLWGPGDESEARRIAAASPLSSVAPPTTLMEMLALVGRFRAYAGTNTAALHMAWMQGVPCAALAGGRPSRTDRPLAPVPSAMLTAAGEEPRRKLRGEAARRAVDGVGAAEMVDAVTRLLGWSAEVA